MSETIPVYEKADSFVEIRQSAADRDIALARVAALAQRLEQAGASDYRSSMRIDVRGTDLFCGVQQHLRTLVESSPALARHADAAVEAAFAMLRPEVVCAFALTPLPCARLSVACRRSGIPLVTYQHGASYGTLRLAQHEVEFNRCDRFFTYGEGVHPLSHVLGTSVARFVPVGSTRIERMRARRRGNAGRSEPVRALVVGELS